VLLLVTHSAVQVKHKFNGLMLDVFREVFNWLPLAFVLNHKVLVLHGGLFSKDNVTLDDLRKVERNRCDVQCYCAVLLWGFVASGRCWPDVLVV
jgi:diadenosine tetraphosphatase ApaH/serine/threonine PP2A family protein phosphatase